MLLALGKARAPTPLPQQALPLANVLGLMGPIQRASKPCRPQLSGRSPLLYWSNSRWIEPHHTSHSPTTNRYINNICFFMCLFDRGCKCKLPFYPQNQWLERLLLARLRHQWQQCQICAGTSHEESCWEYNKVLNLNKKKKHMRPFKEINANPALDIAIANQKKIEKGVRKATPANVPQPSHSRIPPARAGFQTNYCTINKRKDQGEGLG